MLTVGINAHLLSRTAGYRQAGIHQYIWQLLAHLPADDDLRYVVFGQHGVRALLPDPLRVRESRWPTDRPPVRIAWEQLAWLPAAWRAGVDLLHSMAFVTPLLPLIRPRVVTIYDLSFIHTPERFPRLQRLYLQTQTRRSVRAAARVVAISEDGKHDIARVFGIAPARIDVVPPGVNTAFRPLAAEAVASFRQRRGLTRPFFLHVGTLQPRKNLPLLIDAFAQLGDVQHDLVLVGGKGWLYDEIFARVAAHGLSNRVHFTGYVPDADLPFWYNAATALVVPSVYEGFGMPAAQAMASGTPVIVSNVSSLPEVVGAAGLLFDPTAVEALTAQMARLLAEPTLAAEARARGLEQAKRYSWTHSGVKMAHCYRNAWKVA